MLAHTCCLNPVPVTRPGARTTPFFETFREARRRLIDEGESLDDVRLKLETLNLGRLRVAVQRHRARNDDRCEPAYISVEQENQRADGMFMIGQVAALRSSTCQIRDLHHAVSVESTALLEAKAIAAESSALLPGPAAAVAGEIAIVGIGCLPAAGV